MTTPHLRIARPASDLDCHVQLYERGRGFEDPDGYRVVLQNAGWSNA